MKRFLTFLLALCLLIPLSVQAAESGTLKNNITWRLDGDTLTITGSGDGIMADFAQEEDAPWYAYKGQIRQVVLENIYYLGARSFRNYDALEAVDFGTRLYEIGPKAFTDCDSLVRLTMPESFKIFGQECFQGCDKLETIVCFGRFPSFRQNAMWEVHVTILYPQENSHLWPADTIAQLEAAFPGYLTFQSAPKTELLPPETTPPETTPEPTTPEPTTPPPTTPQPTTPAPTTAAPVITTPEPTTLPETTPQPTTPAPTQPAQGEIKDTRARAWTGVAIILAIISIGGLSAAGISLHRSRQRRDRW